MRKRVLSFVLVVLMVLTLCPLSVLALGTINITKQPTNQTVYAGDSATFSIAAKVSGGSSSSTVNYIWYDADEVDVSNLSFTKKISTLLAKALSTSDTLTLSNTTVEQSGMQICCAVYSLKDLAFATSNQVTLTVNVREACDVHTTTYYPTKDSNCCDEGHLAYYSCNVCHRVYLDEACTMEVSLDDITTPIDPSGHDMVHHERQEPTCKDDGTIEYWQCSYCGNRYSNSEGTGDKLKLSDIEIDNKDTPHQLTLVPAKESTCTEKGNKEYYVCDCCGDYFNASGTMEYSRNDVELPLLDHTLAYDHDSNTHWQYCTVCKSIISNTTEYHNDDIQKATCIHKAVCECGYEYGEVDPNNHVNTELRGFKESSTKESGYTGDLWCLDCGKMIEQGHETDQLCAHQLTHVDAKEAGCEECEGGGYGNIEFWYCEKCGRYFTDATATEEVSSADVLVSPAKHYITAGSVRIANYAIQHYEYNEQGHWKACKYCGYAFDSIPSTHVSVSDSAPTCCSHRCCLLCEYDDGQRDPNNHVGGSELQGACEPSGKNPGYTGDEVCLGCGAIITQGRYYFDKCADGSCASHLKHHDAVPSTCTADGTKEYWECTKCGNIYMDANATVDADSESIVDKCTGHELHPSIETLEIKNVVALARDIGMYEYLVDLVKNGNYTDITLITVDQFLANISIKDIDHCSDDDCHWLGCQKCGKSLADIRGDLEETGIYISEGWYTMSEREEHSGGTATCSSHAVCEICGSEYGKLGDHRYDRVETAATCTTEGVVKYVCNGCGGELTEKEEHYPALGHCYVKGVCTREGCNARVSNPFYDVSNKDSFYTAIMWAYTYNPMITAGTDEHHFSPYANCTRGQVVTFLWRAAGQPEPETTVNPFPDVMKSSPFYKAILWGVENGITAGYSDGTFRPNDTVTRAQFVTFLWRYEGQPASSGMLTFNDASTIASGYRAAVAWGVEKGIIAGYNDNTFRPNVTCNRWQVVTFMYRAIGEAKAYS